MSLELESVDLNGLLSNSLSIVREKAVAKRVNIELEKGADLGVPELDMRKTKQIVYNLLSNALKFSPDGGRVVLSTRRVLRGAVGSLPGAWPVYGFPLPDNEYSEFLEICVADSGIGISATNMLKLFQPFSQIDSSLARKFEGTGLGLVMVKILAELHGGTVAVASAEGEGSRFAVWLPLRSATKAEALLPQFEVADTATVAPGSDRPVALVVDDDDQAADLIQMLLEAEGFTVVRNDRRGSADVGAETAPQSDYARSDVAGLERVGSAQQIARDREPGARAGGGHLGHTERNGAGQWRCSGTKKADQPIPVDSDTGKPGSTTYGNARPHCHGGGR
jgi:CheY-like chemotaxis protein